MIALFLRTILRLIEPLGLAWMALMVLAVLLWRRRMRLAFSILLSIWLLLTIVGGTDLSAWLLERLERPWAAFKLEAAPACDVAVVLGGGAEPSLHEVGGVRLTRAGDRILAGLELMRLRKAPVLVVGGGMVKMNGEAQVESDLIKARMESWNLPPGWRIVSLGAAADTHDEALRLVPIAREHGWKRILLVTSASHMRRAVAVYRAAGFEVVPAPCNFIIAGSAASPRFAMQIPGYGGFERMGIWLHEIAGWEMYRRRGWLDISPSEPRAK